MVLFVYRLLAGTFIPTRFPPGTYYYWLLYYAHACTYRLLRCAPAAAFARTSCQANARGLRRRLFTALCRDYPVRSVFAFLLASERFVRVNMAGGRTIVYSENVHFASC